MKNTIIALLCLFGVNCFSQEGVIKPLSASGLDSQNGTYIKDLDTVFANYTGLWQGNWNGRHIELKIEKITKKTITFSNGNYYYEDTLIGKYTVTDSNGTVIANSMGIPITEHQKLTSIGSGKNNKMGFSYDDSDYCGVSGIVYLKRNLLNPNELEYHFNYGEFFINSSCPSYPEAPVIPIPTEIITLTKI